ncbi:MAG: hypothetical protein U0R76_07910 [Candidatus Nanopelagicales bacterium]
MRILLLVGKASTSHEVVAAEATELRAQGHHVALATRVAPRDVLTAAVDEVVVLTPTLPAPPAPAAAAAPTATTHAAAAAPAPAPAPAPKPAAPRSPTAKAKAKVRWARGQVSGALAEPARSWKSVRRSSQAMALARQADVIVAVDAPMVRAGWQLARDLPLPAGPEVVYGLPATESALSRRATRTDATA